MSKKNAFTDVTIAMIDAAIKQHKKDCKRAGLVLIKPKKSRKKRVNK